MLLLSDYSENRLHDDINDVMEIMNSCEDFKFPNMTKILTDSQKDLYEELARH